MAFRRNRNPRKIVPDNIDSFGSSTLPETRLPPGFFCVFVFDEPDIILSDASPEIKQHVLETSSLIPVIDPNYQNAWEQHFQSFPLTSKQYPLSWAYPRGYFTIKQGETADNFRTRVFHECMKSPTFRRFYRRHTATPVPLNASGTPDLSSVKSKLEETSPLSPQDRLAIERKKREQQSDTASSVSKLTEHIGPPELDTARFFTPNRPVITLPQPEEPPLPHIWAGDNDTYEEDLQDMPKPTYTERPTLDLLPTDFNLVLFHLPPIEYENPNFKPENYSNPKPSHNLEQSPTPMFTPVPTPSITPQNSSISRSLTPDLEQRSISPLASSIFPLSEQPNPSQLHRPLFHSNEYALPSPYNTLENKVGCSLSSRVDFSHLKSLNSPASSGITYINCDPKTNLFSFYASHATISTSSHQLSGILTTNQPNRRPNLFDGAKGSATFSSTSKQFDTAFKDIHKQPRFVAAFLVPGTVHLYKQFDDSLVSPQQTSLSQTQDSTVRCHKPTITQSPVIAVMTQGRRVLSQFVIHPSISLRWVMRTMARFVRQSSTAPQPHSASSPQTALRSFGIDGKTNAHIPNLTQSQEHPVEENTTITISEAWIPNDTEPPAREETVRLLQLLLPSSKIGSFISKLMTNVPTQPVSGEDLLTLFSSHSSPSFFLYTPFSIHTSLAHRGEFGNAIRRLVKTTYKMERSRRLFDIIASSLKIWKVLVKLQDQKQKQKQRHTLQRSRTFVGSNPLGFSDGGMSVPKQHARSTISPNSTTMPHPLSVVQYDLTSPEKLSLESSGMGHSFTDPKSSQVSFQEFEGKGLSFGYQSIGKSSENLLDDENALKANIEEQFLSKVKKQEREKRKRKRMERRKLKQNELFLHWRFVIDEQENRRKTAINTVRPKLEIDGSILNDTLEVATLAEMQRLGKKPSSNVKRFHQLTDQEIHYLMNEEETAAEYVWKKMKMRIEDDMFALDVLSDSSDVEDEEASVLDEDEKDEWITLREEMMDDPQFSDFIISTADAPSSFIRSALALEHFEDAWDDFGAYPFFDSVFFQTIDSPNPRVRNGLPPRVLHPYTQPPSPIVPCNHACTVTGFLLLSGMPYQVVYHSHHHRYLPSNTLTPESLAAPHTSFPSAQRRRISNKSHSPFYSPRPIQPPSPATPPLTQVQLTSRIYTHTSCSASVSPYYITHYPTTHFAPSHAVYRLGYSLHPSFFSPIPTPLTPPTISFPKKLEDLTVGFVMTIKRMIFGNYDPNTQRVAISFTAQVVRSILDLTLQFLNTRKPDFSQTVEDDEFEEQQDRQEAALDAQTRADKKKASHIPRKQKDSYLKSINAYLDNREKQRQIRQENRERRARARQAPTMLQKVTLDFGQTDSDRQRIRDFDDSLPTTSEQTHTAESDLDELLAKLAKTAPDSSTVAEQAFSNTNQFNPPASIHPYHPDFVPPATDPSKASFSSGLLLVGDLHGNLSSLSVVLDSIDTLLADLLDPSYHPHAPSSKPPPRINKAVMFLGDYVDRGNNSLETMLLILLYSLAFPHNVFLLRGNHESYISCRFTFNNELYKKYPDMAPGGSNVSHIINQFGPAKASPKHPLFSDFERVFNALPLAILATLRHHAELAPIPLFPKSSLLLPLTTLLDTPIEPLETSRRIFICHAGLTSTLPTLNIEEELMLLDHFDYYAMLEDPNPSPEDIKKAGVTPIPSKPLLAFNNARTREFEIHHTSLWADPASNDLPNANRSPYSVYTTRRFLAANRIDYMIRAHQFVIDGFAINHDGRLATVFSSADYGRKTFGAMLLMRFAPQPVTTVCPNGMVNDTRTLSSSAITDRAKAILVEYFSRRIEQVWKMKYLRVNKEYASLKDVVSVSQQYRSEWRRRRGTVATMTAPINPLAVSQDLSHTGELSRSGNVPPHIRRRASGVDFMPFSTASLSQSQPSLSFFPSFSSPYFNSPGSLGPTHQQTPANHPKPPPSLTGSFIIPKVPALNQMQNLSLSSLGLDVLINSVHNIHSTPSSTETSPSIHPVHPSGDSSHPFTIGSMPGDSRASSPHLIIDVLTIPSTQLPREMKTPTTDAFTAQTVDLLTQTQIRIKEAEDKRRSLLQHHLKTCLKFMEEQGTPTPDIALASFFSQLEEKGANSLTVFSRIDLETSISVLTKSINYLRQVGGCDWYEQVSLILNQIRQQDPLTNR
ncbi:hypothetical protein BLNAU_10840 [Blattamonas nauphoetae]|uniref:Serine/threonine-protein phosphatase n=1 Tax=Blattamonas nauphoetae TaxID=2049346 RepID=A0ABQ9XRC3_9EUKA|nr:hypothetical protein BLNAU_10840 [Blattamonas nauphoetae]